MSFLNSGPQAAAQGLFEQSVTAQHNVGEVMQSADGRVFRYSQAGLTALVKGTLQQASAEVTANQNLTAVAAAVGATSVAASSTVTITANQYAGGYIMVSVTPDQGSSYLIASHAAFTSAAPTFQLASGDAVITAWTTGTRFDLVANPYMGVIINPAAASSSPVGVAMLNTTISYYSWLQVRGAANVLNDGGSTVGTNVSASNATAGAVEAAVTAQAAVGYALTGISTTEYGAIFLTIG